MQACNNDCFKCDYSKYVIGTYLVAIPKSVWIFKCEKMNTYVIEVFEHSDKNKTLKKKIVYQSKNKALADFNALIRKILEI